MKAFPLALLLLVSPAMAQQVPNPMTKDAVNATLPGARDNLGLGVANRPGFAGLDIVPLVRGAGDLTNVYVFRDADYAGGTHGMVNTLASFNTTIRAGTIPHEWNLYAGLNNFGVLADGGEHTGFYAQSQKRSTGATWGAVSQVLDYNTAGPSGSAIGLEINVSATGADVSNTRIALEIYNNAIPGGVEPVHMRADISLDGVFTIRQYGLEVNGFGSNYWGKIVGLSNNARYGYGIDLTGGTCDFAQFISPAFQVGCDGNVVLGTATPQAAGTINVQNGYYAGDTPGVNCAAGVTAATVRVKNGIVTAC